MTEDHSPQVKPPASWIAHFSSSIYWKGEGHFKRKHVIANFPVTKNFHFWKKWKGTGKGDENLYIWQLNVPWPHWAFLTCSTCVMGPDIMLSWAGISIEIFFYNWLPLNFICILTGRQRHLLFSFLTTMCWHHMFSAKVCFQLLIVWTIRCWHYISILDPNCIDPKLYI